MAVVPEGPEGLAHKAGVVHRCICPENMFVLRDGRLKLTNPGLGWDYTVEDMRTDTRPGYAPLELYLGHYPGKWSDVYEICAILYRCLTGKFSPPAIGRFTANRNIFVKPSQWQEDTPPSTRDVIYKGLVLYQVGRLENLIELYARLYCIGERERSTDRISAAQALEVCWGRFPLPIQPCSLAAGTGFHVGVKQDGTLVTGGVDVLPSQQERL